MVRLLIAGSRSILDKQSVFEIIAAAIALAPFSIDEIDEVVSGKASGIDQLGEQWAEEHNIPVRPFPADWKKFGKRAGMLRNNRMAEYATHGILIWNFSSPGTQNMAEELLCAKKPFSFFAIHPHTQELWCYDYGRKEFVRGE